MKEKGVPRVPTPKEKTADFSAALAVVANLDDDLALERREENQK